jgi:hypothetical protein
MDNVLAVILVLGVVVLLIASIFWQFSRSRAVLEHWAEKNKFTIIHSEYRNFVRGPFFWTASKAQTVYYVKVRDSNGKVRSGWVRCGGWFLGLLTDTAEVRWEDAR